MSTFNLTNEIKVALDFNGNPIPVGRLATRDHRIYFEYDSTFIQTGLEISPLKLPLETGLKEFGYRPFEGLPGVFNDSLPDGWGRLLFDRYIRSQNLLPEDFTPLDRLAHIGTTGLGALIYEPDYSSNAIQEENINLDILAKQTQEVLEGESSDVLKALLELNGSSAGARPKALIGLNKTKTRMITDKPLLSDDFEHWLVKFANNQDGKDAGAIEYVYALMAKEAGLEMMPVHLFDSTDCSGFFATQRFDRNANQRQHIHTASGLLHNDFRMPSLDYRDLITLTGFLTKDVREIEKMYRLTVFNVLAHNRDDHSKNFSFMMDATGEWKLSPAYDLTFSSGPHGEQSTMVMGEGRTPSIQHLKRLGLEAGLRQEQISSIVEQTRSALEQWEALALNYGITKTNIKLIKECMRSIANKT